MSNQNQQQDWAARAGAAAAPVVAEAATDKIKTEAKGYFSAGPPPPVLQPKEFRHPEGSFLFCIPILAGPPSPHCMSMSGALSKILCFQLALCACRFLFLKDIMGGLWMFATIAVGWHGWHHWMNITYITCWGVLCFLNGLFDTLDVILPLAFAILTFDFFGTMLRVAMPFAYFLGASLAYHLYLDFVDHNVVANGWLNWFRPFVPDIFILAKRRFTGEKEQLLPHPGGYGSPPPPTQQQPYQQQPYQQQKQPQSPPDSSSWFNRGAQPAGAPPPTAQENQDGPSWFNRGAPAAKAPPPQQNQYPANAGAAEPPGSGGWGSWFGGFGSAASLQSSDVDAAAQGARNAAGQARAAGQQAAGQAQQEASFWGGQAQYAAQSGAAQAQQEASFWGRQGRQAVDAQRQAAQNSAAQVQQEQGAQQGSGWGLW